MYIFLSVTRVSSLSTDPALRRSVGWYLLGSAVNFTGLYVCPQVKHNATGLLNLQIDNKWYLQQACTLSLALVRCMQGSPCRSKSRDSLPYTRCAECVLRRSTTTVVVTVNCTKLRDRAEGIRKTYRLFTCVGIV